MTTFRALMAGVAGRARRIPAWALALIAGAGPALAHPPFGIWPALSGFGLLLWLLDRSDIAKPLKSAFWRGWLAGFAYFLISTWWIAEAFFVDFAAHGWQAPFAVTLLPAGLGLFWGGAAVLYRLRAPRSVLRVLVFAATFALAEWLRGHVLTGFPWNLPGEAWGAGSPVSQTAAAVGTYGLSLLTLVLGAAVGLLGGTDTPRARNGAFALAAATLAVLWISGTIRLATAPPPSAEGVRLRVVQTNLPEVADFSEATFRSRLALYLSLTASPSAHPPQVVIWPEGALPAAASDYLAPGTWTAAAIAGALPRGAILLVGGYRVEMDVPAPRYYNSLVAVRRDGAGLTHLGRYDKHHLVPFGEYLPLKGLLEPLGLKKLVSVGEGFDIGPPPRPLSLAGLPPVQPLICYESLFPRLADHAAPRPAWIVNVSNDAWFGQTSGPWQHLNIASFRAIEEGLPLVRATPTGVSAVVDAFGRPLARVPTGKQGVIDLVLPRTVKITLYGRFGDWLFALGLVIFLVPGVIKRSSSRVN